MEPRGFFRVSGISLTNNKDQWKIIANKLGQATEKSDPLGMKVQVTLPGKETSSIDVLAEGKDNIE